MKRLKFYPILFLTAVIVFVLINVIFISKVDPYEFGQMIAVLVTLVPILILVIISSLVYEITHPIKKDIPVPGIIVADEYEETFKLFKILSSIVLIITTITSIIYIWPSIIHHYFFGSLYILCRFILVILSGWALYLSIKKKGYVRFVGWFILVIIIFMQFWGIGLLSFNNNDNQGNINYNRDGINKTLDAIKKTEALNTGDVNNCFDQKNTDSQAYCVISLAEKNNDINLCNDLSKISHKYEMGNILVSDKLSYFKSLCFFDIAKKTKNYEICNKMITEGNYHRFYTSCLEYFAVEKKDESICDLYNDYYKNISKDLDLTKVNDIEHLKTMINYCKEEVVNGKLW